MATIGRVKTKDIIEIVGIVAVVISLLLLAYEVRQSNRSALLTVIMEQPEHREFYVLQPLVSELPAEASET